MSLTKVTSTVIADSAITTEKISNAVSLGVKIANVSIANSAYDILDDTAISTDGGYIVITGAGFASGAQVLIEGTAANSTSFVSSTELRAQVPAKSAGSYNVYVVNSDGATGIRVNGLTYSGTPTWVTGSTLDNQAVDVAFNVAFNATGATSYANTSALPAGTSLLSNGYFYGTVTGIAEETTYSFTVAATDAENQDSPRTFSVTVTVGPPPEYLYLWGLNSSGQLGLNNIISKSSPVQVGSSSDWYFESDRSENSPGVLVVKSDGTLWGWGQNNFGQLGLNNTVNMSSPVQVGSLTDWKNVAVNQYSSLIIKNDGTLWSCGYNDRGQLGLSANINKSSPTQVGNLTNWSKGFGSNSYSAGALKTDGTLWTWGNNFLGVLGLSDENDRNSPTQVAGTWSEVCFSGYQMNGIKTNNTLWAWGTNGGIISTRRSSPVQVGTDTNWSKIAPSRSIKTDGTLWVWGGNSDGSLGLNDRTDRTSPTQLGPDTNWKVVTSGGGQFAIKTNGTLWSWGDNENGQLGHNDTIFRSSPTQVGTDTNWSKLVGFSSYRQTGATKSV